MSDRRGPAIMPRPHARSTTQGALMHPRRVHRSVLATAIAALVIGAMPASSARADATITVDVLTQAIGGAGCSLTEAILSANQDSSTVEFDPGPPFPRQDVATGCVAGSGHDTILLQ